MSKEKAPQNFEETNTDPSRDEREGGVQPLENEVGEACRQELVSYLDLLQAHLSTLPSLSALQMKKNMENALGYLAQLSGTKEPELRQTMWATIIPMMNDIRVFMYVNGVIQHNEASRARMGINAPANPGRTTMIVPHDWENPNKPLH